MEERREFVTSGDKIDKKCSIRTNRVTKKFITKEIKVKTIHTKRG